MVLPAQTCSADVQHSCTVELHGNVAGGPKGNLPPGSICGKDDERVQNLEHSCTGLREAQSDWECSIRHVMMQACETNACMSPASRAARWSQCIMASRQSVDKLGRHDKVSLHRNATVNSCLTWAVLI